MIIRTRAYPRAALIGNPSDGYYGKTIAFTFGNFSAETILFETPELEIQPNLRDHSRFNSIHHLAQDVRQFGYYGGIRLLKAAVKTFHDYAQDHGISLHDRNFTIRYHSDIPHLVGLAGSSAIITACMRALMSFYGVTIPPAELANLILSVERDELDISAGLQDRVAQVYQGLVYMNFDRTLMSAQGHGEYIPLDPSSLPPLYLAYRTDLAEGSEVFHSNIRDRFERGEPEVIETMQVWTELTDRARECLRKGDAATLSCLMDENFDRRAALYRISEGNLRMIEIARAAGASAKFTGSGGAIIGITPDESTYDRLAAELERLNVRVLRPEVIL